MSKASVTRTGGTAGALVFARLYPDGLAAYDASGNPFPHTASTQADGSGNWTLHLEQTDTMSPDGMTWEIMEGVGNTLVYCQFGAAGGAIGSIQVSKPTTVLEPLVRKIIVGAGLSVNQANDTATITLPSNAALTALATHLGPMVIDKVHVAGKTGSTAGGGGAWVAPAACVVLPLSSSLNVTTPATGTCLLDIGYTPTNAATLADTLFDGRDGHTAAAFFEQVSLSTNALVRTGNENPAPFVAATGKWITISAQDGSSDLTGMVADLYVAYYLI